MLKKLDSLLLIVSNTARTAEFYRTLGFEITKQEKGFTLAKLGNFELHFHDKNELTIKNDADVKPRGAGIYIYIDVKDIDNFFQSLIKKGMKPSSEPRDWPWGNREFAIRDPDGYKLVFYEELKK